MAVDLRITGPGRESEYFSVCSEATWTGWVARMAVAHGFRLLTGVGDVEFGRDELTEVLREMRILRGELDALLSANPWLTELDRTRNRERWDRLVDRLERLKHEGEWRAEFL
jgi:hypothetical protein